LNVVTIIRKKEKTNLIGKKSIVKETIGLPTPETVIFEDDILVVFGENKNISIYCDGQE
jgi:trk system potassium uptake protein TrkA